MLRNITNRITTKITFRAIDNNSEVKKGIFFFAQSEMNWDMLSIFAALFILTITSFHIYIFSLQGVNGEEYSDR